MVHRLLIAAAHKSSGKTTITLGLAAALRARGVVVQPYKKGPDYIDPTWLSRASGRSCFNLDLHLMSDDALGACFAGGLDGADLALVEGNHGLFDGLSLDGRDSNAALAKRLDAPVVLVIDVRGMTRGLAPLLLGYRAFDPGLRLGGVILNRVGGARHESKLRAVVEHYTDIPVLGAVHDDAGLAIVERHLGLMPCGEAPEADARIAAAAAAVARQVDLDRVQAVAASASTLPAAVGPGANPVAVHAVHASKAPRVRIGIARDRAFGFYYPDDLHQLEAAGAELVPFDTLRDANLPRLDGLVIGGGFPESCLDELEANASLRTQIRNAVRAGLPTYAECGGLMYLSRSITAHGRRAEMVGVIPGDAVLHVRPVGRGYVELEPTARMPWRGLAAGTVRAHEFHHSSLQNLVVDGDRGDAGMGFAWKVRRGHGIDGQHDGLVMHRMLASYSHLRGAAGTDWPAHFVEYVRVCTGTMLLRQPSAAASMVHATFSHPQEV